MDSALLMQLQFAACSRLSELAERVPVLASYGFNGQQFRAHHFSAVEGYYTLAGWLIADRYETPTTLQLEVFG